MYSGDMSHHKNPSFRVLDLFSGCGGLAQGMHWSLGSNSQTLETVAAVDIWKIACETFEHNLGIKPYNQPISAALIREIIEKHGPIDVLVGGPPCQGFSTSGKRALDDPRNGLVLSYLEAVEIAQPSAFIMENVLGFTSFQGGQLLAEVKQMAKELGYNVRAAVVQASVTGVPQRRRRFILAGVRSGNFIFPGELENSFKTKKPGLDVEIDYKGMKEPWTFMDATSDLADLEAKETNNAYKTKPKNELQAFLRGDLKQPTDHTAVGHRPDFIRMMSYIPEGKSAMDKEIYSTIPENIRPGKAFPNSYARIRGDQPSPTITRNFTTPSSANCIHPKKDRALSIREGARCQTFPDSFEFLGTIDEKRLQIGNAVPPLLGKALGESLLNALESAGISPKAS